MSNATAPDHYASAASHPAPQHNPYNPYSPRTSTHPGGNKNGYTNNDNGRHGKQTRSDSYEMKSPPYMQKDIEAGELPKRPVIPWQDRMVCGMKTKWLIFLVLAMVLAFVAASLGGILGSEKAIEDNKKKIAEAAKAAKEKIAGAMAA